MAPLCCVVSYSSIQYLKAIDGICELSLVESSVCCEYTVSYEADCKITMGHLLPQMTHCEKCGSRKKVNYDVELIRL